VADHGGIVDDGQGAGGPAVQVKNRLKVLRAERDWSQADLAERAGVSRQTINSVEKGKYDPSISLAFALSRSFGEPIEAIFIPESDSVGKNKP
jgi:putative transcriptional regulator